MNKNSSESAKTLIRLCLKAGKENRTSRSTLRQLTGLCDRTNRLLIEEMRSEGIMICSNSQSNGYWYPTKISEVKHYINEMRKRSSGTDGKAMTAELWLIDHSGGLEHDDNV